MSVSVNLLSANASGIETDISGWNAGSNTTLARSTSRFYSGAASLQLTAMLAGSMSAVTYARVAVTAGSVYTAYAYFGNVTAVAGHQANVFIAWYSAVSGGTAISFSTSANVTLPNSTAWGTPPPTVIATAPAGATYAVIGVNVLNMASGTSVVVDAVNFGPPNAITDNLIPYAAQSCEVDVSGWQNYWNSTVARSSTTSFEGWYSLAVTSTAAGAIRAGQVGSVPVDVGTEYMGYAWVYAPLSAEYHAILRWYDAAGTMLSYTSQTWTLTASTWTRCAVIDKAPAGAVIARLFMEPVTVAAGEVWYFDQMAIRATPILTGSLLGYNAQDFEVDVSAWSATSGCTISRTTVQTYNGVSSMRIAATGGADAVVEVVKPLPVTPRQAYKIVPYIYHGTSTTGVVVDLLFTWLDANGLTIRSTYYRWTTGTAAGWYAPTGSSVAPAGAASLRVGLRVVGPAAGSVVYADMIYVGPGGLGVIADVIADSYGASVALQGLTTGGYTSWGLWRMLDDGTMTAVRGSSGDLLQESITGDLAAAEDYEAPLGVQYRYYLKVSTGAAYLAATSEPLMLSEPSDTTVVIKDPGLPTRWTEAVVSKGGMPDWTRSARQGVNPVRGRSRPVVISDVRTSRAGSMTLVTETAEELADMWWLLETGNTLLIQWPSAWGERDVYVQVGDVVEAHVAEYAGYQDRTWTVPLTEVDRPVGGITGSLNRTWQDVNDGHADWLDVFTTATNWLDVYSGVKGA